MKKSSPIVKELEELACMEVEGALNYLIFHEWARLKQLNGIARQMQHEMEEELDHLRKLIHWATIIGDEVQIQLSSAPDPPASPTSIAEMWRTVKELEQEAVLSYSRVISENLKGEGVAVVAELQAILADEVRHLAIAEHALETIQQIGDTNYLAAMLSGGGSDG